MSLGEIHEDDQVFVNGQLLASNPAATNTYEILNELTVAGDNVITVRVHNAKYHESSIHQTNLMRLSHSQWQIPLTGRWNYRPGTPNLAPYPFDLQTNIMPSGL